MGSATFWSYLSRVVSRISLEARMAAATMAIMTAPGFEPLLGRFCFAVANAYTREPRLIRAIGDLGSLITVAVILAKQGGRGVTLADVQRVVCKRLASPGRVRAIVRELERTGALIRTRAAEDSRRLRMVVSGWLPDALAVWGRAYAESAHPFLSALMPGTPEAAAAWAARFLAGWAEAYERFGFLLMDGYPVVLMFANHLAGHPMLLETLGASVPLEDGTAFTSVSRKSAARSFGLSRAHFAAILAECEARDWMRRVSNGMRIVIEAAAYRELRRWVAREIAWVVELMGRWNPEIPAHGDAPDRFQ
jgi:hypothetical protein